MLGKTGLPRRLLKSVGIALAGMVIGAGLIAGHELSVFRAAGAREADARLLTLIASGETVMGEKITYPAGAPAKITAVILTLQPGEDTGLHTHGVPVFGYVLDGELTVDYEGQGSRIYKAGDALLEAMAVAHNGRNSSNVPMRILAVFMAAEGRAVTDRVQE